MTPNEVRKKFLDFFKNRGHVIVPSSPLLSSDPSVLLTTAGMQQFKPYYTGESDPLLDFGSKNTASIQKCFRTSDIDEVGDETHLTFFEMLGNFSFGGYFKKEAISYAYEFIVKELNLLIDKVTVFSPEKIKKGDWRQIVPADKESLEIWNSLGIEKSKIYQEGIDNFWGPTGKEGPCGPTTEIYIQNKKGQSVEIWNIVFNEYFCDAQKSLTPLKTAGVDTGMGLERLLMVYKKTENVFETDLFVPLMKITPGFIPLKIRRVFADHIKGIVFLISDGVRPSNKEAGYVLRRILRRLISYQNIYKINLLLDLAKEVIKIYSPTYHQLTQNENLILETIQDENIVFLKTLKRGMHELQKIKKVGAKEAFYLYQTFGLPYEIIKEISGSTNLNYDDFEKEFEKHKEISRQGQERKFGGHGLLEGTGVIKSQNSEEIKKITRLHTATHLLHQALREVLGSEVKQAGSDITAQRTRFDFTFSRKLTADELKKIEDLVNEKIKENLPVNFIEMNKEEAQKTGALSFFNQKYGQKVKIFYIGKSLKDAWSKEFCAGPHVSSTKEIGIFKIQKEEGVGRGLRRIRAIVLP